MAATQAPVQPTSIKTPAPSIDVPDAFLIAPQDRRLRNEPLVAPEAPLGVLSNFRGTFFGTGFNMIFRPNSGETVLPQKVTPAPPAVPNEQVLELNLTEETLSFSTPLGDVPNRGLGAQKDIFLNGVSYVQSIFDVTNVKTGKGDASASERGAAIHFEPGLWMHVPEVKTNPKVPESLNRMASIPHGTTINAQGVHPKGPTKGPPPLADTTKIPAQSINPFPIGNPSGSFRFAAQNIDDQVTPRLPQDLSKFKAAGTITQARLDNTNLFLADAIKGQKILETTTFVVATKPKAPFANGGIANIDFLEGPANPPPGPLQGPNADASAMTAIFWVEKVEVTITIPKWKVGDPEILIKVPAANPSAPLGPKFRGTPKKNIDKEFPATLTYTQIQYSQDVTLDFAGLSWPHISVATLVPKFSSVIPDSILNK